MLTEAEYIKKYITHKNMFSPAMMRVIDSEIARLNPIPKLTKKDQKYLDRLIYKRNMWIRVS
tara:strand:+ start:5230 stop:5415 length:186 start_codon:yes stop_codon:yes gene_type:complete